MIGVAAWSRQRGSAEKAPAARLHLVISTDGPRTLSADQFDPDLVPPIVDTTVYFPTIVHEIMALVEADPGIIEGWQAGDVHFVYSADGVRLLRTEGFGGQSHISRFCRYLDHNDGETAKDWPTTYCDYGEYAD